MLLTGTTGAPAGVVAAVVAVACGLPWATACVADCVVAAVTGAPAGGVAPKMAGDFWWIVHCSNSAGVTVNTRKRMFAWLAPQYSLQLPLNAFEATLSGVNHR